MFKTNLWGYLGLCGVFMIGVEGSEYGKNAFAPRIDADSSLDLPCTCFMHLKGNLHMSLSRIILKNKKR